MVGGKEKGCLDNMKKDKTIVEGITITNIRKLDKTFYSNCIISIPKIKTLSNITFVNCKFTFKDCFKGCIFKGVKFYSCNLSNMSFEEAQFISSSIDMSNNIKNANFVNIQKTDDSIITEEKDFIKEFTEALKNVEEENN